MEQQNRTRGTGDTNEGSLYAGGLAVAYLERAQQEQEKLNKLEEDHRIELTLYNLPFVMEGDIDPIIEPLMNHDLEEKLAALKL